MKPKLELLKMFLKNGDLTCITIDELTSPDSPIFDQLDLNTLEFAEQIKYDLYSLLEIFEEAAKNVWK